MSARQMKRWREGSIECRRFSGIYCLYRDDELLYIGQTGLRGNQKLFSRLKSHREKGPVAGRWNRFSWFGGEQADFVPVQAERALAQLEAFGIAIANPGFNKSAGSFKGAKRLYQSPHESARGTVETQLSRVREQLNAIEGKLDAAEKRASKKKPPQKRAPSRRC